MILQLLEVILLLLDLLAEREELLLLGLADEHFLLGALASLEGVTMKSVSLLWWFLGYKRGRGEAEGVCLSGQRRDVPGGGPGAMTYPKPPVLGGAPVSPAPRARAVVVKAARETTDGRAALRMVVRSMLAVWFGGAGVSGEERGFGPSPFRVVYLCTLWFGDPIGRGGFVV